VDILLTNETGSIRKALQKSKMVEAVLQNMKHPYQTTTWLRNIELHSYL